MKLNDYFLKVDHQRVGQLIMQQDRYLHLAKIELLNGNFEKSALFSNHATAVTSELKRMHETKTMMDEARKLLKEIKQRELTDQNILNRKTWF